MLFTCGKHLPDHIISRRRVFWAHKTSVTPPYFIEVSVPSQESEHVVMYLCVTGINVASLCTIAGADPGFKVRGGALKKIATNEGRRETFWGISCY